MKHNLLKDRVLELLTLYPNFRDDLKALVATLWLNDAKQDDANENYDILFLLKLGRLTDYDSISRYWRKFQQDNPALRGKYYAERHGILEEQWRQEMSKKHVGNIEGNNTQTLL